jgi:vancomycin resistance protein YoaR
MKTPSRSYLIAGAATFLLAVFLLFAHIAYVQAYQDRVLPGVSVGSVDLSGTTKDQAEQRLREAFALPTDAQLRISLADGTILASAPMADILTWREDLAEEALRAGRTGLRGIAPYLNTLAPLSLSLDRVYRVQEPAFTALIEKTPLERAAVSATFTFDPTASPSLALGSTEQNGYRVQKTIFEEQTREALLAGQTTLVLAEWDVLTPTTTRADLEPLLPQAQRWVAQPLELTSDKGTLILSPARIFDLLATTRGDQGMKLALDPAVTESLLTENPLFANSAPKNGTFTLTPSGTIATLTVPTEGQIVDHEATIQNAEAALESTASPRKAAIVRRTSWGVFEGPDPERLGIREFLARGDSDFSGSPTNRRKNIALGAERVHGTIVAPGGEFSTMKTLGEITGERGWLPELVIKGNQTIPEYGGGLCQIGTTAFRGVVNTGLPVTERRNHSYRVRYYEPAGTDATLYDPSPDFRFKNDLASHLLITKDLRRDQVGFLFWGTSDGRVASSTKPVVSNIIQPPPKKIIETTDLPVGETKCTESAHAGATARFDYEVRYPNGEVKKTTFTSVYRPWQAVCLVGVAPTADPTPVTGVVDGDEVITPG